MKPSRLTVHGTFGDELVTLYRGEDIVTRRGTAVVTGEPGRLDDRRLTAALRDELATAAARLFGDPITETQRYYTEQLDGDGDYRAYILIGDTASIPFRHHTFTGLDVLVSTDPDYPVVVAYSGMDAYPDLVTMDSKRWKHR